MSTDSHADLLERLFATYEHLHSVAAIEDVVAQCDTQLNGQTPPDARPELTERLARQRLDDLPASIALFKPSLDRNAAQTEPTCLS
jgi:hypothetical protein